jgi:hypothetical protein
MKLFTSNQQLRDFYKLLNKLNGCYEISTESKAMTRFAVAFLQAQVYHRVFDVKQSAMSDYSTTVNEINSYRHPFFQFFVTRAKLLQLRNELAPKIQEMHSFAANIDYVELFTLATAYVYAKYAENSAKISSIELNELVEFSSEFLTDDRWQSQLSQAKDIENLSEGDKETLRELYTAAITIKQKLQNENLPLVNETGATLQI